MADDSHQQPSDPELTNPDPALPQETEIDVFVPPPIVTDSPDQAEDAPYLPYNIVGIGGSAGGVEAYIELFTNLPSDTGMAYIVISHLMPEKKSHLREILSRYTSMPVIEIESGTRPEPDRIYVAPPKSCVHLKRGVLHLEPLTDRIPRTIDHFFRSLAADQNNRAVGVVLSGMDGDGALGLRAIKGEGGITIVQSPGSAQFPDMPRTSIATEHVDVVLPPNAIATQLAQIGTQFRGKAVRLLQEGRASYQDERTFARILALMRGVSGVDFRMYKPATIQRRTARRMLLHRIDSLADYVLFLQANPGELRELHEDALINVTHFFRDPEAFESLKTVTFPRILQERDPGEQVRIWVAGCSSGEEAYSITISLLEFLTGRSIEPPIQVFGTDASEQNIQRARAGIYPETIAAEVSPERLRRFFVKTDKGYQVSKRVRDLCIFARQNLCHDPPFSRMDLISCRNVLIYFGTELQRQLIPTFHYALRPNGYLMLGTSETIREFTDLFGLVDRKSKIYLKTGSDIKRTVIDVIPRLMSAELPASLIGQTENWADVELQRAADRIVLARYGPPGIVVNERMEILQSRGHTSPFLEMRQGTAALQLGRMARDAIAPAVTAAVRRAIEHEVPVQVQGVRVSDESSSREITLEVLPIQSLAHRQKCYLVLFAPAERTREPESIAPPTAHLTESPEGKDRLISKMRHDLSSNKLYLQSLLEERDAKNQELVSANEEIQSANEELQSSNEELETTKEELQSTNEELHTVNDELQTRNAILTQASNDLHNLLNSVNLPVLMLSNELHIRRFTAPTQRMMNLRASDVGRPFAEIRMNLDVDDLTPVFQDVLDTLGSREMEVQDRDGHWYLLRVRPYRTSENKIDGLVVALVDVDQLRKTQQELRSARDFARSVIEGISLPLAVVDLEFRIRTANEAFCVLTGMLSQDLERRLLPDLTSLLWGLDRPLRSRLDQLRTANQGTSFEFEHQTPGEKAKTFLIRCHMLQPHGEHFLLVTLEDITTHQEAERVLKADNEGLANQVESTTKELGRSHDELRALTTSLLTTQEDERRRIARELHDDVSQRLAALEIDSDEIQRSISSKPDIAGSKLQQLRGQLAALADDVRNMSHRLHPSTIEELGLAPALRALTEDFDRGEKMIATFSARNVPASSPIQVATGIYRIAQEALRNVAKHAGRTHVRLTLKGTKGGIRLEVSDAGLGFDLSESRSGLGLVSMEERARMIGGTLEVKSALGQGTTITIDVPLPLSS